MTNSIPPIGIRFTGDSDGVATAVRELTNNIRGLSSVQRQNAAAAQEMATAGKKIASQYREAGAALGALGTTLGVARLTGLIKDAIDTGDAIFKLSQKTGASTEALSTLAFAGRTADVSLDDLETTLKFLAKSLGDLQRGEPGAVAGFRALGLEAKDLKGLSVDQAFLKIADAQARFADGSGKAEAVLRIFGRAGTEIIPLLNDLANGGFDRAGEAAKRLNLIWTSESAKAAQDFNDSIALVSASAAGLAGELTKGAIPAITEFLQGTATAVASLPGPLKDLVANLVAVEAGIVGIAGAIRLLRFAGVFAALTNPFALAVLGIGLVAAELLTLSSNAAHAKKEYADFLQTLQKTGDFATERQKLETELAATNAAIDAAFSASPRKAFLAQDRLDIEEKLRALDERERTVSTAPGTKRPDVVLPDPAVLAARRAAQKAAIEQELQLEQDRIRSQDAINQHQFDSGLQGLTTYFARRRGLVQEGTAAEIRALEAERKTITPAADQAGQLKQRQDLARIDGQILQKRTEGETKLGEVAEQERAAAKAFAQERLGFEAKILQARGQTLQASLDAIEQESRKFDELLIKQGVAAPERRQRVGDFRAGLTLRANVDDAGARAQDVFAEIEAERTRIDQEVEIGILSQRQGQEQLAKFESARLPALREIAAQMQAFAQQLGDPALIQAAAELGLKVNGIAASANLAAQRMARFKAGLLDATEQGVSGFLGSGLDQLGQPDPNSGALEVRQREAEEVRRQIDEANAAAAQGDTTAAGRVQQLTGEYARLQDKIADLKAETFGLDDAFKQFFLDTLDGIRQVVNELVATQLVDQFRGVTTKGGNAAEQLVAGGFGLEAPERLGTDLLAAGPEAGQAAALSASSAEVSAAAAELTASGTAIGAGGRVAAGAAPPLAASAGELTGAGHVLLTAATALKAAAAAMAAANAIGTIPGAPGGLGDLGDLANLAPKGFAHGGQVATGGGPRGPGDTVLAWHDPLEFIVNPRATRRPGVLAVLQAINAGVRIPGFAAGGLVAGIRASAAFPTVRLPSVPRAPSLPPEGSLASSLRMQSLVKLLIQHDPGFFLEVLSSPEGEAVQVQTMARNPNALRHIIDHA